MYKDLFTQTGLSANEAIIYEYLLKNGESTAGELIKKTPLKRGVTYNALEKLSKIGLISETKKVPKDGTKKIAYFTPNHPEKLREYLQIQENSLKKAKNSLEANITTLISDFNLVSNRPGVRYFEGLLGIEKVLDDTLGSKTEIYTYSDIYHTDQSAKKLNEKYVAKRIAAQVNKKIIAPLNNKKLFGDTKQPFTEVKFIKDDINPFKTAMQIYDNKISYQNFENKNAIGVIIEDVNIYNLHKGFFEFVWKNLTEK